MLRFVLGDDLFWRAIRHYAELNQFRVVETADAPDEKHLHARIRFADEGPELRFVDQRTFGGLVLAELDVEGVPAAIRHIAPDPLEPAYDRDAVVRRIRAKRSAIKRVLLDQTVASGIGNIYADEALWRAQVHGERVASTLSRPRIGLVLDHAAEVMREALGQATCLLRAVRESPDRLLQVRAAADLDAVERGERIAQHFDHLDARAR